MIDLYTVLVFKRLGDARRNRTKTRRDMDVLYIIVKNRETKRGTVQRLRDNNYGLYRHAHTQIR